MDINSFIEEARLPDSLKLVEQLSAFLECPEDSLREITNALEQDAGLCMRTLRIANSPIFMGGGIDSVQQAINFVGADDIISLVMAADIIQAFEDAPLHDNPYYFWHRNIYCATAASVMAEHFCLPAGRLFTIGLLRGVGELLIQCYFPEKAKIIALISEKTCASRHQIEKNIIGYHHAELSAALLSYWQMPATITQPIQHYVNPTACYEFYFEAAILYYANYLTNEHFDIAQPSLVDQHIHQDIQGHYQDNYTDTMLHNWLPQINGLTNDSRHLVMG